MTFYQFARGVVLSVFKLVFRVRVVGKERVPTKGAYILAPSRLRALYFTRATAPWGEGPLYHHIGLYAYRRAALERFVSLPPSPTAILRASLAGR